MKEKSRWFYTGETAKTKAVVLIAHGLNLHPAKMDSLARFFTEKNCDVLRMALGSDPEKWEEKFADDYDKAREHAEVLERPLYFVGYSLGALAGLHFMLKNPDHEFRKMALFAPAIHTKAFARLSAWLSYIVPGGCLPSLNLKDYRERNYTTLAEYRKMYEFQKDVQPAAVGIPALIILSRKDELIHFKKMEKFASQNRNCTLMEISNHGSLLPKKYHHLMIDDMSLRQSEWEKILKNLTAHFTL